VIGLATVRNRVSLLLSRLRRRRQKKRILIVDDDPSLLWVVRLLLQEEGYLPYTSADVNHLEDLLSVEPDLILLDVLLSGADGRLISRWLKSQERTKDIPLVLMGTASKTASSLTKSGADDVLTKPFDLGAFLAIIHKYV
jgi:two-component system alkaline phosphatase synthesis response regulator PhoP